MRLGVRFSPGAPFPPHSARELSVGRLFHQIGMSGHAGPLASGGYPCVRKAAVAIERFSLVDPLEMISPSHHRYARIEVDIEAVTHKGGDLRFRIFVASADISLVHHPPIPIAR